MHRVRRGYLIAGVLTAILLAPVPIYAQYTANFQTNIISGVASNWKTSYYVGNTNFADVLRIQDSGVLSNRYGYIGYEEKSSNNTAVITGTGSVWSNQADLYVGYTGSANQMIVTNSGKVFDASGYIGNGSSSSNNRVYVTDGARWQNRLSLGVGYYSSSNMLIISGGSVLSEYTYISLWEPTASNNAIRIDSGSLFATNKSTTGALTIRANGRLIVNGGSITVDSLVVTNGTTSIVSLNAGTLNSGGTYVENGQTFAVGDGINSAVFHISGGAHSFFNGLEIRNNASLTGCGPVNGDALVDSGGSVVADCGGTLSFTGVVTNNGSIVATNGSFIDFYGPVFNNGQIGPSNSVHFYSPQTQTDSSNSWTRPESGLWYVGVNWSAGAPSISQPALFITNASTKTVMLDNGTAFVFPEMLMISNLTLSAPLGSTNTLLLSNIGSATPLRILNNFTLSAGGLVSVNNSEILIDRSTDVVAPEGGIIVGGNSPGTQFFLDGGRVQARANIGLNSGSSNNLVAVFSGGVWSNDSNSAIVVGNSGAANRLIVTNGGVIFGNVGYVGANASGSNNEAVIASGGIWSNSSGLLIGQSGAGNRLIVTNGGAVYAEVGFLGLSDSSSNNFALIASGGIWSNDQLEVGFQGPANQLIVTNGGAVFDTWGIIGEYSSSSNNRVRVVDNGRWVNTSTLFVGRYASSNVLIIAGGSVLAGNAYIGNSDFSSGIASNNVIRVDSGSLVVTNGQANGELFVSRMGGKGSLIINGGSVTVDSLFAANGINSIISFNAGTLNSSATIVSNAQNFVVGNGTNCAVFRLLGGVHSFNNTLQIRTNAFLTGCGTINGVVVVDTSGSVLADCGSSLTFNGSLTNNGTLRAVNGTTLEFYGPLVNKGLIDVINGNMNFHSSFVNHGILLDAHGDADGDGMSNLEESLAGTDPTNCALGFRIVGIAQEGDDLRVTWMMGSGKTNALQSSAGDGGLYTSNFADIFTVTNTIGSQTNYLDAGAGTNAVGRFYRVRLVP